MELTSAELFAGAGGLALGLEQAGFNHQLVTDNDLNCYYTLRVNRPYWPVQYTEIELLNFKEKVDIISGGFPCQAFSYAGKRLGLADVRGSLFYDFARVVEDAKPKMFLAENVKGLVTHDHGRTLQTILEVFSGLGYHVTYKLLNALDFEVPQKRQRVFIIGIRDDVFSEKGEFTFPSKVSEPVTLREAFENLEDPEPVYSSYSESKKKVFDLVPPGGCWRDLPEQVAKDYMGKSYYSGGGKTGIARRLSWDEPSLTILTSPSQKQTERIHPEETRPLSIREAAAIQTFPNDWEFSGSVSSRYKQIGNAVPVKLAYHVGRSCYNYLKGI